MYYSISDSCTVLGKVIQKPDRSFSFLAYLLRGEKNVLIDVLRMIQNNHIQLVKRNELL